MDWMLLVMLVGTLAANSATAGPLIAAADPGSLVSGNVVKVAAPGPTIARGPYGYDHPYYEAPRPYDFGYEIKDEFGSTQSRQEATDGSGVVKGSYGYTDPSGIYRQVDYIADEYGYRVNVKTNEPGTSNQSPADVIILAEEPPANIYVQRVVTPVKQFITGQIHGYPTRPAAAKILAPVAYQRPAVAKFVAPAPVQSPVRVLAAHPQSVYVSPAQTHHGSIVKTSPAGAAVVSSYGPF